MVLQLNLAAFRWSPSFNFTYVKNKIANRRRNQLKHCFWYIPSVKRKYCFVAGMAGPQIMAYDYVRNAAGQIVVDANGIPLQGAYTNQWDRYTKNLWWFNQ
jgi:hypothetical protein